MRSRERKESSATVEFKIYVPVGLRAEMIQWYHTNLNHPGVSRMYATIGQHFRWPGMTLHIKEYVQKCT